MKKEQNNHAKKRIKRDTGNLQHYKILTKQDSFPAATNKQKAISKPPRQQRMAKKDPTSKV